MSSVRGSDRATGGGQAGHSYECDFLFHSASGLILFLVYHDRQPRKAKSAGKFALIGVGLAAAVVLVMGAVAGSRLARQQAVDEAWEAAERSRQEAEDAYRQSQELDRAIEDLQRAMEAYNGG